MELMAGASGGVVDCSVWRGSFSGSAGRGMPSGPAVSMWSSMCGASSRGVEGEPRSIIGCAACGPGDSGGVA